MAESKEKKPASTGSSTTTAKSSKKSGGNMKDKAVPVLVVLVIIAAFAVGLLWGKLQVYEQGIAGVAGKAGDAAGQNPGVAGAEAPQAEPEVTNLSDEQWDQLVAGAVIVKGDEGAKVTMVEFTDYECPFCARFYTDSYQQIMENYVDSGDVRYIMRDLPLAFHPNAKPAAMAARCAGDQNAYWEMHDVLFEKQTEWAEGDPTETFTGFAEEVGLNVDDFTACMEAGTHDEAIDADLALAADVGANGTPTFFINGVRIVGAQPYSAFESAIEESLAE